MTTAHCGATIEIGKGTDLQSVAIVIRDNNGPNPPHNLLAAAHELRPSWRNRWAARGPVPVIGIVIINCCCR